MSELSAKHKALNILRVLSADKDRKVKTSPRPDLTSSQEILAGKYRELSALLATQYVERNTVTRLHSVNLVSRSAGCDPLPRRQCYPDNQFKPVSRRHKKVTANREPDHTPKNVELASSEVQNKHAAELHLDLEQLPKSSLMSKKTVSFAEVKAISTVDDCASTSTDLSDTELIRRILRSPRRILRRPRKVTLAGAHPTSPVKVKRRTVSFIDKQHNKPKRKVRKVKYFPKDASQIERSQSPKRASTESPCTKTEFHLSDNKLSSSNNPEILSWLREKNKLIRKQKRSERKKERQEKLAEQKVAEEKLRRRAESEDKFNQWMKHKREELVTRQQAERKVQKAVKQREALQSTEQNKESPEMATATESKTQNKVKSLNRSKSTKTKKTLPHPTTKEVSENQRRYDKETRHHLVQNLEAERLLTEEKRQKKEAEKRRRRILREAQTEKTGKTDLKLSCDNTQKAASTLPTETKPNSSDKTTGKATAGDNRKNRPSSNPFKGLTYDDWLRQKRADQRKQAKEAKRQEVCDPELDDLIPLLARRRIEQIKIRATRVDSGLRKSRDSPNVVNGKMDRPRTPNGVRPYTWKTPISSANDEKPTGRMKPHPPTKSKKSDKTEVLSSEEIKGPKQKLISPMPDVVNFERPEPQGCEGTERFPCQNPRANQSKEANHTDIDQSRQSVNNSKHPSTNEDDHIKHGNQGKQTSAQADSSPDTIFMTQPNT